LIGIKKLICFFNSNINPKMTVKIKSKDDQIFELTVEQAQLSELLNPMCDSHEAIPVLEVSGNILKLVKEFLEYYVTDKMNHIEKPLISTNMKEVVQEWYADFLERNDNDILDLILAANFMDIKSLLDLTCAYTASKIKGKSPEEIRKMFDIENDFSPEEETQIREENKLCEEY
jgi:S-phase kinase-associated protein 1